MGIDESDTIVKTEKKEPLRVHSFEVKTHLNERMREKAQEMEFPILEEYDFKHDSET